MCIRDSRKSGKVLRKLDIETMAGQRAVSDIVNPKDGTVVVKAGRRITRAVVRKVTEAGITELELSTEDLIGKVIGMPIIDETTGEIVADANSEVTLEVMEQISAAGITDLDLIFFDGLTVGPYLRNTLLICLLYTSPSPRDATLSRMPSSA